MSYSDIELEKISASGKAPVSRIRDAATAKNIFNQIMSSYRDGQGYMNTLVKRALDGNPPYDEDEMAKLGMSECSNLNFRLLESDITHASQPYYSIFREVPTYIECNVNYGSRIESEEYARIFAEEHKRLMDEWKGFDLAWQSSIRGRVTFGYGPMYFTDEDDFRFQYAPEGSILFPALTSLDLDKMELIFIHYDESITNLYQVTQRKASRAAGWNVEAVKKILIQNDQETGYSAENTWEEYQRQIRHNDLGMAMRVKPVKIVHMFIKEFDGKISHAIFCADSQENEYLFYRKGRFSEWKQVIHPMFSEIGDGYWAGVKGLGVKAYNFRDTQNRLKNRFVDAAMKGSQIMAKASSPESEEEFQMTSMGPVAMVPPGVDFMPNPLSPAVEKSIVVDQMLETDLARNTSGYRQNLVSPSTSQPISATEAGINASRQDNLSLQQVVQALQQADDLYEEQIKRLTRDVKTNGEWQEMVQSFKSKCIERGFPKEAFEFVTNVRAFRPIGHGSRLERNQILMMLMSIAQMVPTDVRMKIVRDYIASVSSQQYLETIWPKEEIQTGPTNAEAEAQLENGLFNQGMPAIVTAKQDHIAHIPVHLSLVMEGVNLIKKSMLEDQEQGKQLLLSNGKKILDIARIVSPHVQEHLKLMWNTVGKSKETQAAFNAYEQTYAYVTQLAQQYATSVRAAQKEASKDQQNNQGQQLSPEEIKAQIEWFKVQQEETRKNIAAQAEINRENQKFIEESKRKMAEFEQKQYINDAVGAAKIKSTRKSKK